MAIKFYINNIEVKVQNNATLLSTQDDSLDTATMDLELSQIKNSILPQSKLKVEDTDNNEVWNFVIVRDNVTIVKKSSPMLYKHSLVLTQNIHELTTHIARNTRFTNVIRESSKIPFNFAGMFMANTDEYLPQLEVFYISNGIPASFTKSFGGDRKTKINSFDIELKSFIWEDSSWSYNQHAEVSFRILKYLNNTQVGEKVITFSQGETKKSLDLTDNFFDNTEHPYVFRAVAPTTLQVNRTRNKYSLCLFQVMFNIGLVRHTLYDVLDILRKQCKKDYNGSNNPSLYTMPSRSSAQGKILDSITSPEITFNSSNVFNCICEAMQIIDAVPTLDENGVLGFEYLNDIGKTPTSLNIVDNIKNIDEQNFTNKLIANYQNGRQEYPVVHPSVNSYSRIGSSAYGIPTKTDYEYKVSSSIDYVQKFLLRAVNSTVKVNLIYSASLYFVEGIGTFVNANEWEFSVNLPENFIDLTSVLFSTEEQSLFNFIDDAELSFPNRNNTLAYTQGGKSIYLGTITDTDGSGKQTEVFSVATKAAIAHFFGSNVVKYKYLGRGSGIGGGLEDKTIKTISSVSGIPTKQNCQFQVTYFAKHDGRASIESVESKHEGESFVAQSNANVQLNRLGTNMQGLIARLGTEKKSLTLDMTSYGSRIRKGTLWVDDDGNKYIANKVKTTFSTSSNKCIIEVEMSKNFNAISSFTKLDQEKRFYEISERLTSKGYENITEFVYLSKTDKRNLAEQTAISRNALYSMFKGTLVGDENTWKVDMATIKPYEDENDTEAVNIVNVNNISSGSYAEVSVPIHSYGLGNMICLEMGYESPLNAGDRLTGSGTSANPYMNRTTLYTASNGYADKLDVAIYQDSTTEHEFDENYPLVNPTGTKLIDIAQFYYYKKSNEIFHLNYEIAFMPSATYTTDGYGCKRYQYEEIFVGSRFIDNNSLISTNEIRSAKTLYLYVGTTDEEKYSIIDKKALGTNKGIATITVATSGSTNSGSINVTFSGTIASAKSWSLADEKGNLYLSVNQNLTNATELNLYYFTRINRL